MSGVDMEGLCRRWWWTEDGSGVMFRVDSVVLRCYCCRGTWLFESKSVC